MESSDSESKSDHAASTMASGFETGSGQASNAENNIPELSSAASASTAFSPGSSLLSTTVGLGMKETRMIYSI